MSIQGQRSAKDLPYISEKDTPEAMIRVINDLISEWNFVSKNMSLQSNFNCQIIDVQFASGETKVISHSLGVLPKYRIILRQEGNGVISDIPSGWNKYQITLKNEGAVAVKATIMIVRE